MPRVLTSLHRRPLLSAEMRAAMNPVRRGLVMGVTVVMATGMLAGCSALDVTTPSLLRVEDFQNADGALAFFNGVRWDFLSALDPAVYTGGVLADEFYVDTDPFSTYGEAGLDKRESQAFEESEYPDNERQYARSQHVIVSSDIALTYARQFALPSLRGAMIAELLSMRGFTLLGMAEQICPGFAIRKVDASQLDRILTLYDGAPQTADSAFNRALADFDSAIVYAGDSARVLNIARVGKARALLGLGRFADAAAAAASVPTGFVASAFTRGQTYSQFRGYPGNYSVANRKGTNGMDYVSAADPRLPLTVTRHAYNGDTTANLYIASKLDMESSPIVYASGVEARLIEAESQLATSTGAWLTTINALRTTAGLSDTTDPGTVIGRENLVFRERAFWLFGTAHRLGDLRRLISRYGRAAETVFPTGTNQVGATYGTATSIPFAAAFETKFNSAITGCTSR